MAIESLMPTMDFRQAPTLSRAWHDDSRVRIVIGPVGSGKTTWCCGAIGARMLSMPVCKDGVRRYRAAIVRTSLPTMRTTTLATWKHWYPPGRIGHLREQAPIVHTIRFEGRRGEPPLEAQIIFLGLDEQKAIDRLKSFEITDLYMAELSELQQSIFEMARGRIGRYPPVDAFPKGTQRDEDARELILPDGQRWVPKVIADTNQTDDQHWLAELQNQPPHGWSIYQQPPAVLEVERIGQHYRPVEGEPGHASLLFNPDQIIGQAGRSWAINPGAENLIYLQPGYYHDQQLPGASLEYIRRYLQAKRVYMEEGKPVVPEFNQELHVRDALEIVAGVPLRLGLDGGSGTLQPAAVIGQRHPRGNWLIHEEVCGDDVGIEQLCDVLVPRIESYELPVEVCWSDPATNTRDELFAVAIVQHLRNRGIRAKATETNDQELRIQALKGPFNRMVDGQPGILISARGCPRLVRGLAGKYHFRKLNVTSTDGPRYANQPEKTQESHPCEALGYLLYGDGEGRRFRKAGQTSRPAGTMRGNTQWDPLKA